MMTHGSLFSGIGGFDLASDWMGWNNMFHCEWNPFCQKVLKHYWPKALSYEDITKTDFSIWRGRIDIVTGGFPCQPYSAAGKRLGKDDERHLWPEMLRAIREIQPAWVVGENVHGIINWNGGMVFDEVQAELEAEGYEVQAYILPASGVNAPHQRYRVWFVAYSKSFWSRRLSDKASQTGTYCGNKLPGSECGMENNERIMANTEGIGMERSGADWKQELRAHVGEGLLMRDCSKTDWKEWPITFPICDGDDGLSGKLDSITFSKWRSESVKAAGNAIVPQVAHQIFKAIELYSNLTAQHSQD